MSVIEVIRTNYPEKTIHFKNGTEKFIPARYECKYRYEGKTIGFYDSKDDIVYLNDDYINAGLDYRDRKKWAKWCHTSPYDRAKSCPNHEAYDYLFAMLGIDETTRLSEYMDAF